jgi:hypothetical protein
MIVRAHRQYRKDQQPRGHQREAGFHAAIEKVSQHSRCASAKRKRDSIPPVFSIRSIAPIFRPHFPLRPGGKR